VERLQKLFILWLSLSSFVLSSLSTASPITCEALLSRDSRPIYISESAKVKNPEMIVNIKIEADNSLRDENPPDDSLVRLFQMFGMTQSSTLSEKMVSEKGQLLLGIPLNDFVSLQAEYVNDKLHESFYLVRISLINNRNGQEQTLSKEPLDYRGVDFIRHDFAAVFEKNNSTARSINPSDIVTSAENSSVPEGFKSYSISADDLANSTVKLPPVIAGETYKKIGKWSKIVEQLSHSEISIVDSIHAKNWAIAKGQFRRFMAFAKDRFFKQAVGIVIVYCLFHKGGLIAEDAAKIGFQILQSHHATISVKLKETDQDGTILNSEEKFKITVPDKNDNSAQPTAAGVKK
jgi:hypothetical protein